MPHHQATHSEALQRSDIDELIAKRSNRSLYLSARSAMQAGNFPLAVRFLSTLAARTSDIQPKIELAELWQELNQPLKALQLTKPLIEQSDQLDLNQKDLQNLRFIYAKAAASNDQFADAQQTLRQILLEEPAWEEARRLQIELYMRKQEWNLALQAIDIGLKALPSPIFYQYQAMVYERLKQPNKAVQSLKTMQQLMPGNALPVLLLSRFYRSRNNLADAEQVLRQFLKDSPDELTVYNALGQILVQTSRMQEALTIYQTLLDKTGGAPEVHSALGLIYFQEQQFVKAKNHFRQALDQQDNDEYRYYLAASMESLQQHQDAKQLYLEIKPDSSHWADASFRLAAMDFTAKDYTACIRHLEILLKKQPNHSGAWVMLSSAYLVQKKFRKMLDETKAASTDQHISTRLLVNRAMAYEQLKEYTQLENTLRQVLEREPQNAEALNFLGYSFAERAYKLDEAEQLIQRALSIKPNDPYYLDSLAWVYHQSGQHDKAEAMQRKALEKDADDPTILEHFGDILWAGHKFDQAREQWKKAIEMKHEHPESLRNKISQPES